MNALIPAASPLSLNTDQAAYFLTSLAGLGAQFDFRAIHPKTKEVRNFRGTFEALRENLVALNRHGYGIFVVANETDGQGRGAANIVRVRTIWCDDDHGTTAGRRWPIEPSVTVETSPGKFQYWWFCGDDVTKEDFAALMRALVAAGCDPNCADLPRVLRIPGFLHTKSEPFLSRIVAQDHEALWSRLTRSELLAAFPDPAPVAQTPAARPAVTAVAGGTLEVMKALGHLSPACGNAAWMRIAMCLHELGERGFVLFDEWSQACPEKYEGDKIRGRWDSIKDDKVKGVTLASLFHMAKEHGYVVEREILAGFGPVTVAGAPATAVTALNRLRAAAVPLNISLADAKALPRRDYIVDGLLQRRKVTILAAPGATGKSLATLTCAVATAMGDGRALGIDVRGGPYKVLLVNHEDDIEETQRRLIALYLAHGFDADALQGRLLAIDTEKLAGACLVERRRDKTLAPSEMMDALAQFVQLEGFDVVIIDPLRALHAGNEVDNSDMSAVMQALNAFASRLNIALLVVHHTHKPGRDQKTVAAGNANAISGAGAIVTNVRLAKTLLPMSKAEADALGVPGREGDFIRLDNAKGNYRKAGTGCEWFEKLDMRLPNEENAPALKPIVFRDAALAAARRAKVLVELTAGDGNDKGFPTTAKNQHGANHVIAARLSIDPSTLAEDIATLEREGLIARTLDGRTERWAATGKLVPLSPLFSSDDSEE